MKKHISYRSSDLLDSLLKSGKSFFSLKEAMSILKNREPDAVRKLVSDMTKRGLILRIKDGLYNIIPYEEDPVNYFPNWHLIAEAIMQQKKYYIGFYSALDIHGLITQPSLTEQIVTEKQVVPKLKTIKKVKFEFITMSKGFFGYEKKWIDDFNKVYCSDLEKTYLDCLHSPGKANGIVEILKALYKGVDRLEPEKLYNYLVKFESQAVYKRLGFILNRLDKLAAVRDKMAEQISSSYTLLDPSLPKDGKYNREWRIIDNVGIESALLSTTT